MLFPLHLLLLPLLTLRSISAHPYCSPVLFQEPGYPKRHPFSAPDCAFIVERIPENGYLYTEKAHHNVGQKPVPLSFPARFTHRSCEVTILVNDQLQPDYPISQHGSVVQPDWWAKGKKLALDIMLSCSSKRLGGVHVLRMDTLLGPQAAFMRVTVHIWEPWGGETYTL